MTVQALSGTRYEDDFYTWTQEQDAHLRAGEVLRLDLANLAEEIDCLGRGEFNRLVGAWRVVLLYMLKADYRPDRWTRDGNFTIWIHRNKAEDVLKDSPGLTLRMAQAVGRAYGIARLEAADETGLALKTFPKNCPYTLDDIRSRPFPVDPDDTTA